MKKLRQYATIFYVWNLERIEKGMSEYPINRKIKSLPALALFFLFLFFLGGCSGFQIVYPEPRPEYKTVSCKVPFDLKMPVGVFDIRLNTTKPKQFIDKVCKDSVERQGGSLGADGCTLDINHTGQIEKKLIYSIPDDNTICHEIFWHGLDAEGKYNH